MLRNGAVEQVKRGGGLLACALLALSLILCGCSSSEATQESQGESAEQTGLIEVEIPAPDFTLRTMAGGEVTLSDLAGTPVVLNFWAVRCEPCKEEMPYFDALAQERGDSIKVITVDIQDSPDRVNEFFGNMQPSFTIALDDTGQVASAYSIRYTPTTYLVDSNGVIRLAKIGAFQSEAELRTTIDKLMDYA
jgi:peroxiredoxin